jgi:hypothetical protein
VGASGMFVLFKHTGWKEPVMYHCSAKWATFLLSLRDWVERGKGRPELDDLKIYVGDYDGVLLSLGVGPGAPDLSADP